MKKRKTTLLFMLLVVLFGIACSVPALGQGSGTVESQHGLNLSSMVVEITSQGHSARFQLYDTTAAKEFYNQLPLELDLTNFRDAQWMFYPPNKLNVKDNESYHDGKKGELSYYAPWGDVFMLYKDFYARDDMHRLGIGLSGIENIEHMRGSVTIQRVTSDTTGGQKMRISVGSKDFTATFANNSSAEALKDLLARGSITIAMSDYGGFEKVGSLGATLPRNDERINTDIGDIILYLGNQFVIYYDTNSYSLTRLGKIENTEGLRDALGRGNVTVTLSLE